MDGKEKLSSSFAKNTLDEIPTPAPNARHITGLVKRGGRVMGYQLSDDQIIDREEGVALAKAGGISGVGIAHRKETEYLKSIPDGSDNNNLSHLPTVHASFQEGSGT